MCEISVIIPVRDEQDNIYKLIDRLDKTISEMKLSYEVIFITDINTDDTVLVLEKCAISNERIKTLKLTNSFGQHIAVLAGLDHCQGNSVVIMDGDLQDSPEDIPLLYNKLSEGFDVVYAEKEKKNDSIIRNISSWLFNFLFKYLSDQDIQPNSSMFRIISRKALNEVVKFREVDLSLTYIFSYINLPSAKVMCKSGMRGAGKTKYNFFRLFNFALSSMLSFSRKPLKTISLLGLIMSFFSFFYMMIVLIQYLLGRIQILGWATLVTLIIFLGGIQLLSLGVIGEYIGRLFIQSKNRPLYIIEKKFGNFG